MQDSLSSRGKQSYLQSAWTCLSCWCPRATRLFRKTGWAWLRGGSQWPSLPSFGLAGWSPPAPLAIPSGRAFVVSHALSCYRRRNRGPEEVPAVRSGSASASLAPSLPPAQGRQSEQASALAQATRVSPGRRPAPDSVGTLTQGQGPLSWLWECFSIPGTRHPETQPVPGDTLGVVPWAGDQGGGDILRQRAAVHRPRGRGQGRYGVTR